MGILRIFTYCLLALLLSGCYETFSPDIDEKPVLCINALIKAGEPVDVNISHTWIYSDFEAMKNHEVKDAEVSIYANDERVTEGYIPKEGDRIRIVAKSDKYGSAESETVVPYSTVPKLIDWDMDIISQNVYSDDEYAINIFLYFNLAIKLEISDISDMEDYYRISFKDFSLNFPLSDDNLKDPDYFQNNHLFYGNGYLDYNAEPLFFENVEELESIYGSESGFDFFTDKQFSGSAYTLNLLFIGCHYQLQTNVCDPDFFDCGKMITLHSVSKSYYDWEYYDMQIDSGILADLTNWGFNDPIWGYSNVSTGAGVVAAESSVSIIVNLKDKLEKFLP
ncbi:MAG: DUF4249 domain-containing protein [Muribaculaceae bacterium]|nr:DUF4249 domain-containing protein [Muribaculaceae bacterium]